MNRDSASEHGLKRLLNASWPLFSGFGVDVRVHWGVVLVPLVFFAQFRASPTALATGPGWAPGISAALAVGVTIALYATVWFHEMSHVWAARRFGVAARSITLSPMGGLAHLDSPSPSPAAEICTALAGPVSQAALTLLLGIPYLASDAGLAAELDRSGEEWATVYQWFLYWQVALVAFNLLPVYPMDGGRALRGFLARRMHANKASVWTAQIGYAGAIVMFLVGLGWIWGFGHADVVARYGGGLLALIGLFAFLECRRLQAQAQLVEAPAALVESWKAGRDGEAWKDSVAESERLSRAEERRERRAAEARRQEEEQRHKIQERIDQLLDRINEVGGVENLSAAERRELAEASELLRRETSA